MTTTSVTICQTSTVSLWISFPRIILTTPKNLLLLEVLQEIWPGLSSRYITARQIERIWRELPQVYLRNTWPLVQSRVTTSHLTVVIVQTLSPSYLLLTDIMMMMPSCSWGFHWRKVRTMLASHNYAYILIFLLLIKKTMQPPAHHISSNFYNYSSKFLIKPQAVRSIMAINSITFGSKLLLSIAITVEFQKSVMPITRPQVLSNFMRSSQSCVRGLRHPLPTGSGILLSSRLLLLIRVSN